MADWTSPLADWSARGFGALAGSSVSLVYMLPKRRREAISRLAVGVISGLVFGPAAGVKLVEWLALPSAVDSAETMLMGASAASFASWWGLGIVVRALDRSAPVRKEGQP